MLSDVNFVFVRIDVRFGGCRKARVGSVSLNFFLCLDLVLILEGLILFSLGCHN